MRNSIFYYKELTLAEVGKTRTHEIYVRMPNNFKYEDFFKQVGVENGSVTEVNFSALDITNGAANAEFEELRFVYYFSNSNKEKRLPGLRSLFEKHSVKEGDIFFIESRTENGNTTFIIKFYRKGSMVLQPSQVYFSKTYEDRENEAKLHAENDIESRKAAFKAYLFASGTFESPRTACNYWNHVILSQPQYKEDMSFLWEAMKSVLGYETQDLIVIDNVEDAKKLKDIILADPRNKEYGNQLVSAIIGKYIEFLSTKWRCTRSYSEPRQIIFYGAPGTGKSHEVKRQTGERLESSEEVDLPNVFRTTFHPDTDYASFVGCYKPAMQPTSKEEKTLTGKDEEIAYSFVPQVFTDAYVYAYNNPTTPTYLVIEEINRGNCAQIFGDLFQLLDRKDGKSEYKIKADKDLAKYLNEAKDKDGQDILKDKEGIKDGKLCLPANLHILATMNTSDQSLFPMDSAFKRRWDWECIPIDYENEKSKTFTITINGKKHNWHAFLKVVNKKILDATGSEDKQMGNFFIKGDVDEKQFINKVMFYLWNDICKEEYETKNNFFRKYADDEKKTEVPFTFNDLFEKDAKDTLDKFMIYLKVDEEEAKMKKSKASEVVEHPAPEVVPEP